MVRIFPGFFRFVAFGGLLAMMSSCNGGAGKSAETDSSASQTSTSPDSAKKMTGIPSLTTTGSKPAWAPSITTNMQAVLEKLKSLNGKPIEALTAKEARQQPTPTDAVMGLMKDNNIPMPTPAVDTSGKDIPVAGGNIHLRIYTPKTGSGPFPIIVYYHGGGFVIADLNTYDAAPAGLSAQTGAVVVSVAYRQSPEHKFPVPLMDGFAAYQWVLKNAADLKGDTSKIALAGESAGGNMACNVSMMARDKKIKIPNAQVLVYPVANNDMNDESYLKYDSAKPLNKPMMAWFGKNYLPSMSVSADPRFSLVKANLKGLPPTTIIGAELDPLQTEGKLLADKLKAAGVTVDYKLYDGVTHEFFGMATVLQEAKDAEGYASDQIKKSW